MADVGAEGERTSVTIQRRIEWSDTDASGHYHNTAAFRLLEEAETLLLSRLGLLEEIYGRLPRVRIEADFLRPLRFHQIVDVSIEVAELGRTSIAYSFHIRRGGEVCVSGRARAVLLDRPSGTPVPWEERHRRLLTSAGAQIPESLFPPDAGESDEILSSSR